MEDVLKVVAVALRLHVGIILHMSLPYSHSSLAIDLFNERMEYGHCSTIKEFVEEEGFLLSDGEFASRYDAMVVAKASGQVSVKEQSNCLMSYHIR